MIKICFAFQKKLFNLLFFIFISFSYIATSSSWTENTLFVTPKEGRTPWLQAINEAKVSIHIAVYRLRDPEIIKALKMAVQKGIQLDLLREPQLIQYQYTPEEKSTFNDLQKSPHVKIYHLSKRFNLAHYKMIIIDQKKALIGTGNLDHESIDGNEANSEPASRDFIIPVLNSEIVSEMLRIFKADCQDQRIVPQYKPLIWGPDHQRTAYLELLNSAKESILIYQPDIQDEGMVQAIVGALKAGVDVKLIMSPYSFNKKEDRNIPHQNLIFNHGGQLALSKKILIHTKIVIVDGKLMYLGSCNMYSPSIDGIRELGILIDNPNIIQQVVATFDEDWNTSEIMKEIRKN